MKRSARLTAILFLAALMFTGCGAEKGETSSDTRESQTSSASGSTDTASSQAGSSAVSEESTETSQTDASQIVKTPEEAKKMILTGGWQYLDGSAFGEDPEKVVPGADKNAWYYGSALWFKDDGTMILTSGGSDINGSYRINEDCTIEIEAEGVKENKYALCEEEKYGNVLYSKTDKNIRFYMTRI